MRRTQMGLAVAALLLSGVGQTFGGAIQLLSPSDLNPADTTGIYPQSEFASVPSPYRQSVGGNNLTFTTATGTPFFREDQGSAWSGDFPNGTRLLYTNGQNGPIDISFATGVGEVGLLAQSNISATHTFSITAYDGITALLTFTVSGDGFASFIGTRATGSDMITRLHVASDDNDFAIGPVTFGAAVPEPSSLLMAGTAAFAGLGCAWRYRR